MKKTLLFLTLAIIGFASCKKEENTYNASPFVPPYHVEGLTDITIQKSSDPSTPAYGTMRLNFIYENQEQEKITLSVEGAPQGMVTYISDSVGYPSFTSMVNLIDSATAPGNYALKLVVQGRASGRREYAFDVKVLPAPVINNLLAANGYNSYTSCGSVNGFIQNITAVSGSNSRILFSNFDNTGNQIEGIMNGNSNYGYITIPTQTVNGVTYYSNSSSSYYQINSSNREVRVYFNRSTGSGTGSSCSLYMSL